MLSFLSMVPVAEMPGAAYAFNHSDLVGKGIVLILFIGSIFTWTIMLEKGIGLLKAKRASEGFIARFREKKFAVGMGRKAMEDLSPVGEVCKNGIEKLTEFYGISIDRAESYGSSHCPLKSLTTAQIEAVRTTMERAVSDQILRLEDKMSILATAVSVSPFLGLFGTVWGIMIAFTSLAAQGRADIQALAPGISGALLTTVVGLLVAIPSLIGYNITTITIRQITVHMDNFVEEFLAKVKLEQFDSEESGAERR